MEGWAATNPYSPPTGDIEYREPRRPEVFARALYSPRQMLAASLFGSFLIGLLMLWLNYRAMALKRQARLALLVGIPLAIFWVTILPSMRLGPVFAMVAGFQFYGFCNPIQGPAVYRHYAAGGQRRSNWMVAGFVFMSVVLGLLIQAVNDMRAVGL